VLVDFYSRWNQLEPGKGFDAKGTEWKTRLEARVQPIVEKKL
jgi:hypothetical protein